MALKEFTEAVDLFESAAAAVHKAMEDGEVKYSDLRYFLPVIVKVSSAFNGIHEVIAELKGANGEELEAQIERISDAFQLIVDDLFYPKTSA